MNKILLKIFLIGMFLYHSSILLSQSNLMEIGEMKEIVEDIEKERQQMYLNKIASIKGYKIKGKSDSTLINWKQFDSNGNLIENLTHRFRRFKDTDHRYFFYDSLNRRVKEFSIVSFTENFKHDYVKYQYDSTGQISEMFKVIEADKIEVYRCQTRKVSHDSTSITNNTNGTLNSVTFFDYPELNEDSMSITETHNYHYSENGSLVSEDIYLSGKLWRQIYYNSIGAMIERIEYDTRSKREKILFHNKWVYGQNGLLIEYLNLKKSGKPKTCIRYHYQYR